MDPTIELTPAQRAPASELLAAVWSSPIHVLRCNAGMGRTTILQHIREVTEGTFVGIKEFLDRLKTAQPLAIEETFVDLIVDAFKEHRLVIVDDLHLLWNIVDAYNYPRSWLLDAALTALLDEAGRADNHIVFGVDDGIVPQPVARRARFWQVADFSSEDYKDISRVHCADDSSRNLDFERIHRFAPMLNVWQLRNAFASFVPGSPMDTEGLVDYLSKHNLVTNVEIDEVRPVDWKDLKGLESVVEALEAKVALPFENHTLAAELNLKARRGVLLSGPPGTGKTTIGRALARRLRGKFFLIDGTTISGTTDFYEAIEKVFEAATQNAPSVIFIDDTDVIFEGKQDSGLYRYLLTKLDGLESASVERVCVMMTAMDVSNLPPALLRSGRIELWLETVLPDTAARAAIVEESVLKLPPPICFMNVSALITASQGLTGADLKSVVEDGKLLLAHDRVMGKPLRPVEEYFLEAIETVRTNRRNYLKRRPGPFGQENRIGFGGNCRS